MTVSNTGKGPLYRVWAEVDSADPQWKGARLLFRKIDRESAGDRVRFGLAVRTADGRTMARESLEIPVK